MPEVCGKWAANLIVCGSEVIQVFVVIETIQVSLGRLGLIAFSA